MVCMCEVKNVVIRITWRQHDLVCSCEGGGADHVETS